MKISGKVSQWANKQMIKFRWRSESPSGYSLYRDCFPYSSLGLIGRYGKWLTDKSAAHSNLPNGGTGKTCLGGGMLCPNACSSYWYDHRLRPVKFIPKMKFLVRHGW